MKKQNIEANTKQGRVFIQFSGRYKIVTLLPSATFECTVGSKWPG